MQIFLPMSVVDPVLITQNYGVKFCPRFSLNLYPTSQTSRKYILSPAYVTNIRVTKIGYFLLWTPENHLWRHYVADAIVSTTSFRGRDGFGAFDIIMILTKKFETNQNV